MAFHLDIMILALATLNSSWCARSLLLEGWKPQPRGSCVLAGGDELCL